MKDDAERAREAVKIATGGRFKTLGDFTEALLSEDDPATQDTLIGEAATLLHHLAAFAQQPEGWRPIETAPKDGTKFDAWVPSRFGGYRMADLSFGPRGKLRQHGELTAADLPRWPTHWMPRPAPPAAMLDVAPGEQIAENANCSGIPGEE